LRCACRKEKRRAWPSRAPGTRLTSLRGSTFATETMDSRWRLVVIVEKKHLDNFTILYVEGLIKLGESAEFFSSALENVLKNESTNVIIDFTKIDYIDSTGIGELVGYLGKFTNQNRKLILVNPSERIQKLLKLAKLDAVFKIYSTEEEAVAAESGSPARA
jgi:anti-sigma B factor antagonist